MKWMYGKQDWKTRERGLENCYLMTNGLGGFSSMTMTGAVSRNDHALLMACTTAPNCRYNMIHRLKEELLIEEGDELTLSTQEFEEQTPEDGYLHLAAFSYEAVSYTHLDVYKRQEMILQSLVESRGLRGFRLQ